MKQNLFYDPVTVHLLSPTEHAVLDQCLAAQNSFDELLLIIAPWGFVPQNVDNVWLNQIGASKTLLPVTVTTELNPLLFLPLFLAYGIKHVFASYCTVQAQQQFSAVGINLQPFPLVSYVDKARDALAYGLNDTTTAGSVPEGAGFGSSLGYDNTEQVVGPGQTIVTKTRLSHEVAVQHLWNAINSGDVFDVNIQQLGDYKLPGLSPLWQQLFEERDGQALRQLRLLYSDTNLCHDLSLLNLQQGSSWLEELSFLYLVMQQIREQSSDEVTRVGVAQVCLQKLHFFAPNLVKNLLTTDAMLSQFVSQYSIVLPTWPRDAAQMQPKEQ